jgi:phosphatidylinositol-4,5-bisphosphate 3-kinase
MHVASVWVRFGLMLEAYCRGSQEHMKALARQVGFMMKLRSTSELVRMKRDKDKARVCLQETLSELHVAENVASVLNPLDPSYRFSNIRSEYHSFFFCSYLFIQVHFSKVSMNKEEFNLL